MILLDTDHVSVLKYPESPECARLNRRLQGSDEQLATTIVTVEEQFRGWLALISRKRDIYDQLPGYDRLAELFEFFSEWEIVRLDERAADEFERLRKQHLRVGTMDLKIAAIVLVNDALLLSANLRDFQRVPGLKVENWLI